MPRGKSNSPRKVSEVREVGKEGAGSGGDVRDRFRDAYKPGNHPAPSPGFANPLDFIKRMRKRKPKPKP